MLNKFSILQGIVNFNTSIESLEICNFVDGNNIIISLCVSLCKNQKLKELAITNCHLKSESIAVISQILEQNTSIEKLDLSHQPLDQPIKSLEKGLQNNKSLKYLVLNNAVLDQSGIELLNKSLIDNATLQSLSLKDNQLDHFKASAVIDILKNCNTLKHLDLSRNQLGAYFASTIGKVFCEGSLLETLNLSYNQLSDLGITMIVRYISNLTHLKTLDLSNNNKTEFGVVMIEETFKTVAKPENFSI